MAFRSASAALVGADGASATFDVPAGVAADDIVTVALYMESTDVITPPAGFTQKVDLQTSVSQRGRLQVFWKRLTGADTGTYAFTFPASTWRGGGCVAHSGRVTTGDPWDGTPGTAESSANVTTLPVSTSAAGAGGDVVGIWTSFASPESFTPPAGYTERVDGDSQLTIVTLDDTVAGSTGSVSATANTASRMKAFIGVLPAAAGSGSAATPSVLSASATVPTPTVRIGTLVAAALVAAAAVVPTPTVSNGTNATASPSAVIASATVATPAVHAGATAAPSAVARTATVPAATVASHRYVTGISGNGRYFTDQDGNPILVRGDSPWSMFTDLSSTEVDTYLGDRADHGTNVLLLSMIGSVANGAPNDNGATFDGILPFTGGDPTVFNEVYWTRMDSYIGKARDLGITLMIYPMDGWNCTFGGTVFDPGVVTNTDCQTYGQTLATRYADYPNIIWSFGGDYNENIDINDRFNSCLTGIRAAGNVAPVTIQLEPEKSLSDDSTFWEPKVDFNFVYTYFVTYKGLKDGYDHVWSGSPTTRPAIFGEGAYENSFSPHFGTDTVIRRQAAWALTSGSPGEFTGQEGVWNFNSDWETRLDTTAASQLKAIRDTFEALEWWTLVPDDANQLVTAGRGTRITTDSTTYPSANTYVTAARSPDGTLAVIYLPNAASAITVDMTKIGTNPTATWVDPTSGATSAATVGSTYSKGGNAVGDTDWLLILTGDAGVTATPSTVASVAVVPAPTVRISKTVAPSTVVGLAAVPAPTVQAGSTSNASPAIVLATAAVPAPVMSTGEIVSATVIARTVAVFAPTIHTDSTAAPSAVARVAVVSSPSISVGGSATVSSSTVAASAAIPALTLSVGQTATPAALARTAIISAPTASGGTGASPATIARAVVIPAPSVSGTASATATPAGVAVAVVFPVAAPSTGGTTAPSGISRAVVILAPTVRLSVTVSGTEIHAAAEIGSPLIVSSAPVPGTASAATGAVPVAAAADMTVPRATAGG